jgi:hypothetical protein
MVAEIFLAPKGIRPLLDCYWYDEWQQSLFNGTKGHQPASLRVPLFDVKEKRRLR